MDNTDKTVKDPKAPEKAVPRKRRPWWRRALKVTGITIAAVILLLLIVITAVVAILTPERFTPLVEKYATEYIDGQVNVDRVELTFWSTFPRFRVDVDGLEVVSHALREVPDSLRKALPAGADTLLRVEHFDGDIHVLRLLTGEIEIYNVNIVRPAANLVVASPTHANYNIMPTTEEVDTAAPGPLPDISLGSFVITGDAPIRYFSLPDSTDVALTLTTSTIRGAEEKSYNLEVKGKTDARITGLTIRGLRLGLGGRLIFDPKEPTRLETRDLAIGLNEFVTRITAAVNTSPATIVERLEVDIPKVKVADILAMLPPEIRAMVPEIDTDMTVEAAMKLTRPYEVGGRDSVPSFDATLKADAGRFKMHPLDLTKLKLDVEASVDGRSFDRSVLTLKDLRAEGKAVAVSLDGKVTNPVSDPLIDARFNGRLDVSRLPRLLLQRLPATIAGVLEADATVNTRLSYLDRDNFHRIKATGRASLNGFRLAMRDSSLTATLRHAEFDLGTSNSFVRDSHRVDSLLTASLKVDTLHVGMPGMEVGASRLMAGVGVVNRASSADTSMINPIGGTFRIGLLNMVSDVDSMRLRLRDINMRGALTRYHGGTRAPLLALNIDAGRIRWADRFNRATLRDGAIALRLHPRSTEGRPKYTEAQRDSLRAARASRVAVEAQVDSLDRREMIDMRVDRSMRQMLRRWQAEGSVKAAKARVMTPYFPLKCRMTDLDVNFTTDSIAVNKTRLTVGKSDFTVSGYISNITRALTSSRGAPIKVHFHLDSEHIDVNELAEAAFAGSAFAEHAATIAAPAISDSDNDDVVEASVAMNTGEMAALLVPSNVDAELEVHAQHVTYADVAFNHLTGAVRVHDGALNLDNLSASSDAGSVDLTALYSAPTRRDLDFSFGMRLNNFNIASFLEMMPAVDSLMPLLRDIRGVINAEMVATTSLDSKMNIDLPSLSAALRISGDSLVLMDAETFRTVGKWLLFKDKSHNMVDHMSVQMIVQDSRLQLYPFMFDIDRYRLGVMGSNDLALNFNYHVSVLKSPIPFKFGINISGNADKMKVRLGGAKFKENMVGQSLAIVDTTRINLLRSIAGAFRAGVKRGKVERLHFHGPEAMDGNIEGDTISHADSLLFIREGLLPAPPAPPEPAPVKGKAKSKDKKKK